MTRHTLRRTPGRVIVDPDLLASLKPSAECIAEIERLERATRPPARPVLLD